MAQLLPYKGGYYLWNYLPSLAAGILFLVLFLISTGIHSWRMFRHRVWFHVPFVCGCLFEAIGYVGFSMAHSHTDKLGPYIIQSFFILVSPALFAASVYMILGRLITRLPSGPTCSIIRPAWLTKIFVLGDLMSFLVQGSGGGLMVMQTANSATMGQSIILGGLFIQIFMFGLFLVAAVVFHVRYVRLSRAISGTQWGGGRAEAGVPWIKVLWMLYSVSALIMVRSIFRVVEYIQGHDGYSLNHQWTLLVFDSTLMFLVTVLFYVMYHPDDMTKARQQLGDGYLEAGTVTSVDVPLQQK